MNKDKVNLILYNTVSLDGYIASPDEQFDWNAADYSLEQFFSRCQKADALIMGRRAWDAYILAEMSPLRPDNMYILSSSGSLLGDTSLASVVSLSPKDLIQQLEQQGCHEVLLVGGSKTNTSFLEAGLVDELLLDVQPTFLGSGLPIFKLNQQQKTKLVAVRQMGSVTHCHYQLLD
jgi:dihydrofolate reductase